MNIREQRFIVEYVKDENGTRAAQAAGYAVDNPKAAAVQANRLLNRDNIRQAIEEHKRDIAEIAGISKAAVVKKLWQIANADPNELIQVRRNNCRHCWGLNHNYQWIATEYAKECEKAVILQIEPPGFAGGFDFDANREPNSDCPVCSGNGEEIVHVADTRKLTGTAKLLYAGVKKTKDGIQILTRDQDAALREVGKFVGIDVKRLEHSGPDGKPIANVNINATAQDLTDEQLLALINGPDDSE